MKTPLLASLAATALALAAPGATARLPAQQTMTQNQRPRAREAGVRVGVLPAGARNAITDVAGVRVGHTTIVRGDSIRTGVTAILPHGSNLFREKVPGAVYVGNGFGKLAGSTQVEELGEIETPILLTSTLSVPRVADALVEYMITLPGNEDVRSVNPLVGETNDGTLNDIRSRPVGRDDVFAAIKNAREGAVEEGAVGAGTGTIAFGFKGGIGTSSRKLPPSLGGYTVGVLVQTNFGGVLAINGAPVGRELGKYYLKEELERANANTRAGVGSRRGRGVTDAQGERRVFGESLVTDAQDSADGSCMIVIATDAPVDARNLKRMAKRAMMGLARTGAAGSNGSGDYAIAFSTATELRIRPPKSDELYRPRDARLLSNDAMSPLFLAVIEATEESIYNSLFRAQTTTGNGRTVEALPLERTLEILRKYNALDKR
jgi:D-aminopeptidase